MLSKFALGSILIMVAVAIIAVRIAVQKPSYGCPDGRGRLTFGFYAYFTPVSHSADQDPSSDGFGTHAGYEADLLTALEEMEDAGLSFSRIPIEDWDDIWLRSAGPEFDIVGGGITVLDSRTMDSNGHRVVGFTSGHIGFRQSLLVRRGDASRLRTHADLTSGDRVGAIAGTTGESRLLEIVGLVDVDGNLVSGTGVETPSGQLVSDGGPDYAITAAGETPNLDERIKLHPPGADMPQVIYMPDENVLMDALESGDIDALARGEIGNRDAEYAFGDRLAVTALDDKIEYGGFSLSAEDAELRDCIDERLNYLTDNRVIGYAEWLSDSAVFMRRARAWNSGDMP